MQFLFDTTLYGAAKGLATFLWGAIRNAVIVGLVAIVGELANYPVGDHPQYYGAALIFLIAAVNGLIAWMKEVKPNSVPETMN